MSVGRRLVRWLDRVQRPAAIGLVIGAAITFASVVTNLLTTGTAKWATLLIAADLVVSGTGVLLQTDEDR